MRSDLERLCERERVSCVAEYGGAPYREDWPDAHPYKVRLRYQGRKLTVPFYMGPALESEPSAADVLACLVSDVYAGEQTFEDFAYDMGFDTDSRKAEATWRACAKLAPRVRRFLGERFEDFAGAQH
jgi:hypothetical protein